MIAESREHLVHSCRDYCAQRQATYTMRRTRFSCVSAWLRIYLGMDDGDILYDLGAGHCQFGRHLQDLKYYQRYVAIDGALTGHDLNADPPLPVLPQPDYAVALEVVEHLEHPARFLRWLRDYPLYGAVITTPNPEVVDVKAIDPDHISVVEPELLEELGYQVERRQFFSQPGDTLVAAFGHGKL